MIGIAFARYTFQIGNEFICGDFFTLPEQRRNIHTLLAIGYSIILDDDRYQSHTRRQAKSYNN